MRQEQQFKNLDERASALTGWQQAQAQLDSVLAEKQEEIDAITNKYQVAIDQATELIDKRMRVVRKVFPEIANAETQDADGTTNLPIDHRILKLVRRDTYKVNSEAEAIKLEKRYEGIIRWKPELAVKAFKALANQSREAVLRNGIERTRGNLKVTIEEKKR